MRGHVSFEVKLDAASPVTNDLLDYRIVGLTADGHSLVTVASDTRSEIWTMSLVGSGKAKRIPSSKADGTFGIAIAPDGRILYTSVESGALDIWIMRPDGSDRRPLTSDSNTEMDPNVALTGDVFFYARTPAGGEIRRMRLDGDGVRTIARGVSPGPLAVSDDGRWVVYLAAPQGVPQL